MTKLAAIALCLLLTQFANAGLQRVIVNGLEAEIAGAAATQLIQILETAKVAPTGDGVYMLPYMVVEIYSSPCATARLILHPVEWQDEATTQYVNDEMACTGPESRRAKSVADVVKQLDVMGLFSGLMPDDPELVPELAAYLSNIKCWKQSRETGEEVCFLDFSPNRTIDLTDRYKKK